MKPFLLPLLLLLALTGCRPPSKIVGNWVVNGIGANTLGESSVTFGADGHFKFSSKRSGSRGASITTIDSGTYTLDGNQMKLNYTNVDWEIAGGPADKMAIAKARLEAKKPELLADLNKANVETLHWQGNDEITSTDNMGNKIHLRRAP